MFRKSAKNVTWRKTGSIKDENGVYWLICFIYSQGNNNCYFAGFCCKQKNINPPFLTSQCNNWNKKSMQNILNIGSSR